MTRLVLGWLAGVATLSAQPSYLAYSSYLGGNGVDVIHAIATDSAGNVYVTGATTSSNFPVTGAFQSKQAGVSGTSFGLLGPPAYADAFVAKLNPAGQLVYATYLGGSLWDEGLAIAVDAQGSAYVLGVTYSSNFPTTPGALQPTANKATAFLTKLSPDGSALVYSTYLGVLTSLQGYEFGSVNQNVGAPAALALDSAGNAYIGGAASAVSFPATAGAYRNADGAFVAKVNASGSAYVFVTYLGGGAQDITRGIALDSAGNIYATGNTSAATFPVTAGGIASKVASGDSGAFIVKLDPTGSTALYSAVLGGSGNTAPYAIAVDAQGNAVVGGYTFAADFPVMNAFQAALRGPSDGFVSKLNGTGSQLMFSTFLGGTSSEGVRGLVVDSADRVYVSGWTTSADFPVTANALPKRFVGSPYLSESPEPFGFPLVPKPAGDAFAARLTASGTVDYASYVSGSGEDDAEAIAVNPGGIWVAGSTQSSDFPTSGVPLGDRRNPGQCSLAGSPSSEEVWPCEDGFVSNIVFGALPPTAPTSMLNTGSLIQEPIAPAAVVTLFGNGIGPSVPATLRLDSNGRVATMLGGTQVLFNGAPAPLILAQSNQITLIVPDEVASAAHATVSVQNSGQTVGSMTVPVNLVDPALLTFDPSGAGQAAALNQDGTVNSAANPAAQGSILVLWAIGAGGTSDGDGAVATMAKNGAQPNQMGVQVAVGNPFNLVFELYVGPSPGSISALTQINVRLPMGVTGNQVPVFVVVGGQTSQYGMTIAVK